MTLATAALVEVAVGLTVAEAAALLLVHRRTGHGVAPRDFLVNLTSGLGLMLALRAQTRDAGAMKVGFWLAAAGIAHATDLAMRWQGPAAPRFASSDEVSA